MDATRNVIDGLGYEINLELRLHALVICSYNAKLELTKSDAQIVRGYINAALKMPRVARAEERLSSGQIIAIDTRETPFIQIEKGGEIINIYPPSWIPVSCELDLLIPRMKDKDA